MFLQASVILLTGRGVPDTPRTWSRHTTPPPQPGADTPRPGTPPRSRHPPGTRCTPSNAEHAGRYGQWAGGTHPTGMQSCFSKLSMGHGYQWHKICPVTGSKCRQFHHHCFQLGKHNVRKSVLHSQSSFLVNSLPISTLHLLHTKNR